MVRDSGFLVLCRQPILGPSSEEEKRERRKTSPTRLTHQASMIIIICSNKNNEVKIISMVTIDHERRCHCDAEAWMSEDQEVR